MPSSYEGNQIKLKQLITASGVINRCILLMTTQAVCFVFYVPKFDAAREFDTNERFVISHENSQTGTNVLQINLFRIITGLS